MLLTVSGLFLPCSLACLQCFASGDELLFGRLPPAGVYLFLGVVSFLLLEKAAGALEAARQMSTTASAVADHGKGKEQQGSPNASGGVQGSVRLNAQRRAVFYLNVVVNGLDNLMHGAAIAAAFCSSTKVCVCGVCVNVCESVWGGGGGAVNSNGVRGECE